MVQNLHMRVLFVSPTFGDFGGMEFFVFALASEIQKSGEAETRILFKTSPDCHLKPQFEQALNEAPCPVQFATRLSHQLVKAIAWSDIVHMQNLSPDVIIAAKLLRKPVVSTIQNKNHATGTLHERLWIICLRLLDRRWYNSRFVESTWDPKNRLRHSDVLPVISRLPNPSIFVEPQKRSGFIFLARWIANKGLEELLQAYHAAKIKHANHPLILVGDGPLRLFVETWIKENNVPNVSIKGFVSTDEKNRLIASSKWLVAPAKTREDLGLTPIEARSIGVPCIVTRDGGLPEAAGKHALLCEPGDVAGLQKCLEVAANMSEHDYIKLASSTHEELKSSLKPLSCYLDEYKMLLGK